MLAVGAKVGLVGRNGVGKSTLFKLILGDLIPDGGEIGIPKKARIAPVLRDLNLRLDVDGRIGLLGLFRARSKRPGT